VVVNPDGSYTYTPEPGYSGEDSFTYTLTDKDGDQSTATVTITVKPPVVPNDVPVAVPDVVETDPGQPVSGDLAGNDKPSGDGGNVWSKTSDPQHGTVVVNPDGSYTYTPEPGYSGEDSFTYTLTDKDGDQSTATVTIEVLYPPPSPVPPVPEAPDRSLDGTYRPDHEPLQPLNPLEESVVRDPSVYFHGAVFDQVIRLPIPLHPVVYVNPAVQEMQAQRAQTDPLGFSDPSALQSGGLGDSPVGAHLGMDPALYVQHAVRDAQRQGWLWDRMVEGRLPRVTLGSDGLLATPSWLEPLPEQIVPGGLPQADGGEPLAQKADADGADAPGARDAQRLFGKPDAVVPDALARPQAIRAAAPSFTDQLRGAVGRAPVASQRPGLS
jgi:hypothetical protein